MLEKGNLQRMVLRSLWSELGRVKVRIFRLAVIECTRPLLVFGKGFSGLMDAWIIEKYRFTWKVLCELCC